MKVTSTRIVELEARDVRFPTSRWLDGSDAMCGSDWPVSLLNGGYDKVWRETVAALTTVAGDAASRRILEDTPAHLYGIAETTGALTTPTPGATDGRAH